MGEPSDAQVSGVPETSLMTGARETATNSPAPRPRFPDRAPGDLPAAPVSPGAVAAAGRFSSRASAVLFLLLALAGIVAVVADRAELRRVLAEADWRLLAVTVAFVATSYTAQGWAFVAAGRALQLAAPAHSLFAAGVISGTVNNLVSSGGFVGYGVRVLYLGRRGVPSDEVLAACFFLGYVNHIMLTLLYPLGLAYLGIAHPLSRAEVIGLSVVTALMVGVLAGLSLFWWAPPWRSRILRVVTPVSRRLLRHDTEASLREFAGTVETARSRIVQRRRSVLPVVVAVAADWSATILVLWFCLAALGYREPAGVVVTAFAVGIGFTTVSMIPTGVGLQDFSLTGTLALLGVPIQAAILANGLYRAIYNLLPFGLGMIAIWRSGLVSREATRRRS